ncbi:flagellar assembly protein FliW [bacterium]|nr:MAG: flagellar assembly protein FliW [bacterium]
MKTTLLGTRFGTIEFDGDEVLQIEGGLVGLSDLRHFVMFEAKPGSPFSWLQSLDDPSMAFLVTEPGRYVRDYESEVARRSGGIEDAVVLATATVPAGRPNDTTLNLSGPIVFDAVTRIGKQMVLDDAAYTTRYRVFPALEPEARLAA